jgi:hypothetical protein
LSTLATVCWYAHQVDESGDDDDEADADFEDDED